MIKRILGIPPHLSLIFSLMLLTFWVTDRFNTAMAFINHDMTKGLLLLLACCDLLCIVLLLLLAEQRTAILRLIFAIPATVLTVATAALLYLDHANPARLLFTTEGVKIVLLLLALASMAVAILLIVCQRRAARQQGTLSVETN